MKKEAVPIMLIEAQDESNDNLKLDKNALQKKQQLASQLTPGIIQRLNRFGLAAPAILIEEMSQSPCGKGGNNFNLSANNYINNSKGSN